MITSHSVKDQLKLLDEKKISFKELIREYLSNIKRDNNKYRNWQRFFHKTIDKETANSEKTC